MLIYITDEMLFEHATTLIPIGGSINITQSTHLIDTEAGAPSTNLNTIVGSTVENLLYIRPATAGKTIVLQHNVGNIILATPKEKQVQAMFLMQRLVLKVLDQGIQEVFSTILNKAGKGIEASAVNAVTGESKTIDIDKFPSSSEEAAKLFSDEKETSPEFSSEELQEAEKITKDFLEELSKKGKLN